MPSTNKTENLQLSQYTSTDKVDWLQSYNSDMLKIDNAVKVAMPTNGTDVPATLAYGKPFTDGNGVLWVGDKDAKPIVANCQVFSNPNLLINSDFRNPVNQRTVVDCVAGQYGIDRWLAVAKPYHVNAGYITGETGCVLTQPMESADFNKLVGKVCSISCEVDGVKYSGQCTPSSSGTSAAAIDNAKIQVYTYLFGLQIYFKQTANITWAKLELGSVTTPFVPRPYAQELAMCQRHALKLTDTCGIGIADSDTKLFLVVPLSVPLRANPAIVCTGMLLYSYGENRTVTSVALQTMNNSSITLSVTSSGLTPGKVYTMFGGTLMLDSEI